MRYLVLTWNDIVKLSIELTEKIIESGFKPDVIVGVMRGGWVVAKIVEDLLGVQEIASLEIKFYKGIGEKAERPILTQPLVVDIRDKKVLVVDDVADSGRTLQTATEIVRLHGAREVKTATLYVKPWSIIIPDYYSGTTTAWIVFPWEYGEVLREVALKNYGQLNYDTLIKASRIIGLNDKEVLKLINVIVKRCA
ncbi:phosphoribosyltransferase [Candidatus Geothermarchaeota archaeon]|nr:MAG: phosphoribosyltransferase [Candidatus Geothermarchaeota archaeon]